MDKTIGEVVTNLEVVEELIESAKAENDNKIKNSLLDDIKKIVETSNKKLKKLEK